jgi:LPXTG-motif cell wall-anchored protein
LAESRINKERHARMKKEDIQEQAKNRKLWTAAGIATAAAGLFALRRRKNKH